MIQKTMLLTALGPIPKRFWPQLMEDALGYQMCLTVERGFTHSATDFHLNGLPNRFLLRPLGFVRPMHWDSGEEYYAVITTGMRDVAVFGYGGDRAQVERLNSLSSTCHYFGIPYVVTLYS